MGVQGHLAVFCAVCAFLVDRLLQLPSAAIMMVDFVAPSRGRDIWLWAADSRANMWPSGDYLGAAHRGRYLLFDFVVQRRENLRGYVRP